MREPVTIDDELLFRAMTSAATDREQEAVAAWRRASDANEERYRELASILAILGAGERALVVDPPPATELLVRQARARRHVPSRFPPRLRAWTLPFVGLSAAALALGFALVEYHGRAPQLPAFGGEAVATGADESRSLSLRDGTRVTLGPRSRLRTALRGDAREVWVDGRAEFAVAPRPGLRFLLHTPAGEVTDLGTRFVVRVTGAGMQLAVFEGRVGVRAPAGSVQAGPGELVTVVTGQPPLVNRVGRTHSPAEWVHAALVFEATPLAEVGATVERHYGIRVLVPAALARRTVTAWFLTEPSARQALTAICRAVGASCAIGDTLVVFSP